jgi:hypothetical protein
MRAAQVGMLLRVLGLTVGVAAVTALLFGFDASYLSPFLIKVAIYKLAFIAALVLLIVGAMIGRRARAQNSGGVTRES